MTMLERQGQIGGALDGELDALISALDRAERPDPSNVACVQALASALLAYGVIGSTTNGGRLSVQCLNVGG